MRILEKIFFKEQMLCDHEEDISGGLEQICELCICPIFRDEKTEA
jgi:hypothetical protein